MKSIVLLLIFALFSLIQNFQFPLKFIDHEKQALNCFQQIIGDHFSFREKRKTNNSVLLFTFLITPNLSSPGAEIQDGIVALTNKLLKWPIETIVNERYEFEGLYFTNTSKIRTFFRFLTYFYLIIVDSVECFQEKLSILSNLKTYNPNANYLVYFTAVVDNPEDVSFQILMLLWKELIFHTCIFIPLNFQVFALYNLKTLFRTGEACTKNVVLHEIDKCKNYGMTDNSLRYYSNKMKGKFNNCIIDVVSMPYKPFVINETAGLETEVLHIIGESIQLRFKLNVTEEVINWGEKISGIWNSLLGKVYTGRYIAVGNIGMNLKFVKDFDCTHSHSMQDLVWVVPITQFVPKWKVLITIFTPEVWALCVCSLLFFTISFYVSSKVVRESRSFSSLQGAFLSAFRILIQNGTKHPSSYLTAVFFSSFAIFTIIISSVYTSYLINVLKTPQREAQIVTTEDVVQAGLEVGGIEYYRSFFNDSDNPTSWTIYTKFQTIEEDEFDTATYWLNLVANGTNFATIASKFFIDYLLTEKNNSHFLDGKGLPKVSTGKKKILYYPLNILMRKGYPFLARFNDVINMMLAGGLVQHIRFKYVEKMKKQAYLLSLQGKNVAEGLSIDHLQGAFAILLLGYIFGSIILAFEVSLNKFKWRKYIRIFAKRKQLYLGRKVNRT